MPAPIRPTSGSSSIDPDGDPLTYAWTFGDGQSGTGVSPSHVYADNGTYTASLTVRDPGGLGGTGSMTISVFDAQPSIALVATSAKTIAVDGTFSMRVTIGDPGKLDAPWVTAVDWGNGQTTTSRTRLGAFTLARRFTIAGTYTVSGTVTDKDGIPGYSNSIRVIVR